MRTRPLLAAGVLTLLAAGTPAYAAPASSVADGPIGGYTATVSAAPVSVKVYEPVIPLPASPQAEADLSYTQVTTSTGPSQRALASTLWPGAGLGDGFATISSALGAGARSYPVQVNATYPGGKQQAEQSFGPAATMRSSAGETDAEAAASTGPAPPAPRGLLSAARLASMSSTRLTKDTLVATTSAVASDLVLAGGLVRIDAVRSTSTSASGAKTATVRGRTVVTGLTVAGQEFAVDAQGVRAAGRTQPTPTALDPNQLLKLLGVTLERPTVTRKVDGSSGTFSGQALRITVDTTVLKKALAPTGYRQLYDTVVQALPQQVQDVVNNPMLPPLVDLGPKVVFDIGLVDVATAATPQVSFAVPPLAPPAAPPTGAVGGTVGGPVGGAVGGAGSLPPLPATGVGSGAAGPVGGPGPVVAGGATTPVTSSSRLPSLFGGLPPSAVALALLAAALLAGALRRAAVAAGVLPGGAGACGLGRRTGVPDLRSGR